MKHSKKYSKTKRCKYWGFYTRRRNALKELLEVKNFEEYCKRLFDLGY